MKKIEEYREMLSQMEDEVLAAIKKELRRITGRVDISGIDTLNDQWEEHLHKIGLNKSGELYLYHKDKRMDLDKWNLKDFINAQYITENGLINILEHLISVNQ